jgi:hypothetical protein
MNVRVILRVTLEVGVEVASQHDADLNGAKGLGDVCEFHIDLHKIGLWNNSSEWKEIRQEADSDERSATRKPASQQTARELPASKRVQDC